MKKATGREIIELAEQLSKAKVKWHFHILTPGCMFNKNKRFALILEDTLAATEYINLSVSKQSDTAKKLAEFLHGKNVAKIEKTETKLLKNKRAVSPKVKQMIARAKELNLKGIAWHHHTLFPECIFNHDKRYYTLIFEDPLNSEVIQDMSKEEPIEALRQIEPLFYAQKK